MALAPLENNNEEDIVFDFEEFLERESTKPDQEIPSTNVSLTLLNLSGILAKKDIKRGTVVCRHWLRGLCMKGIHCEFLHQYDMAKMPECRWGMDCQVPECPFRHVPDEERMECAYYIQGFCVHGPNCRYRHVKFPKEKCPETADFFLQTKHFLQNEGGAQENENQANENTQEILINSPVERTETEQTVVKKRKVQPVNEFFKIAICKHWEKTGACPFGAECHFAHGKEELRPFPDALNKDKHKYSGSGNMPKSHETNLFPFVPSNITNYPSDKLPDYGKSLRYIILISASYQNLAHSVHHKIWSMTRDIAKILLNKKTRFDGTLVFISVKSSIHFQGCFYISKESLSNLEHLLEKGVAGSDLSKESIRYDEKNCIWKLKVDVQWLRICELPYTFIYHLVTKDKIRNYEWSNGEEIEKETGHSMLQILYDQPQVRLHFKSVEDENKLPGKSAELSARRRHASEIASGRAFFPPPILPAKACYWPTNNQCGFIFTCTTVMIDECFRRFIFAAAKEHKDVVFKNVKKGTPLFLYNQTDSMLLGYFEASSEPDMEIFPKAFISPKSFESRSHLPVQVKFSVRFTSPPISTLGGKIKDILGDKKTFDIGSINAQNTQSLANLFAELSGVTYDPAINGARFLMHPQIMDASRGAIQQIESGELTEYMYVNIDKDEGFNVAKRIIGPSGSNLKRIVTEAGRGVKVRLRGKGSGNSDNDDHPLVLIISSDNQHSFNKACQLGASLIENIRYEYEHFIHTKNTSNKSTNDAETYYPPLPPDQPRV